MHIGSLTGAIALEDQLSSKLSTLTASVWKFVDSFGGAMAVAGVAASAFVGAITGAIVSIVTLGEKGSTILGVEEAFNRLAVAAGSTGEVMIRALSEGVRNTVDSMELMQATTRLLASGVKLSAADLKLMAQTAREVGKATGTDAAGGLNILSSAMLTGNVRSLKRYGIQLDLVSAEKKFRESLGGTTAALSAAGKLEVTRIATLEGMRSKLVTLGESELSFGERVRQAQVWLGNWVDTLAKAVASSPNVVRAWDAISDSLQRAFGGTSQTLLEWIVGWVNRFADAVAYYGPPIIATLGKIRDWVVYIWEAVIKAWDLVPDWFKNLAKEAGIAAGAVYLTSKAIATIGGGDLLTTAAAFATITSGLRDFALTAIAIVPTAALRITLLYEVLALHYRIGGVAAVWSALQAGLLALAASPAGIAALFVGIAAGVWQVINAIRAFGENWERGGGTLWGFLTLKEDDNFVRRWLGYAKVVDGVTSAVERAQKAGTARTDVAGNIWYGAGKNVELEFAKPPPKPPITSFTVDAAEAYNKKVAELVKTLRQGDEGLRVFASAFDRLTPSQLASYSVLQRVVPELDKLRASGVALNQQQLAAIATYETEKVALMAKDDATLASTGITLQAIEAMKRAGLVELDVARSYNTTTEALSRFVAMQSEALASEQRLAAFEHAAADARAKEIARVQALELAADKAIDQARERLDDLVRQRTMTTTQYQIQKIKEWEASEIAAYSLSGASAEQIEEFNAYVQDLSDEQVAALKVDQKALTDYSKASLQEVANKAAATYAYALAHAKNYTDEAIKHFKKLKVEAENAAKGVQSSWDRASKYLGNVSDILDAIPGKFAEVASMAARGAQAVIANIEDPVGMIIAGATAAIGIFTKLFGGLTDYQKRVRAEAAQTKEWALETQKLRIEFIAAAGGMDTLAQRAFTAGTTLDRVLDARTPEAYKAAIDDLNKAFEFQDSAMQLLDETAAKYGLTLSEMGPRYRQGKLDEEFRILYQDQEVLKAGGVDYDTILRKQVATYKTLIQTAIETGATIPIAMQPAIMRMDELGLFVDEAGQKMFDLTKLTFAETLDKKFETLIETIGRLVEAIERGLSGAILAIPQPKAPWADWGLPPRYGEVRPEYMARGGRVLPFRARGTDTVPAMLTPGETVIPAGQAGDRSGQIGDVYLDGDKVGRVMVPHIASELAFVGVGAG